MCVNNLHRVVREAERPGVEPATYWLQVRYTTRPQIYGFQNLKKICPLDSDHAPFGGILSTLRWDLTCSIRVPNSKFVASPVPKMQGLQLCPNYIDTV